MPVNYEGNPSNDHGCLLPHKDNAVQIKTIVDGVDDLKAETIHGASVTVLADWVEFLKSRHAGLYGVTPWDAGRAFTVGQLVVDPTTFRVYRARISEGNVGQKPSENTGTFWDMVGFSASEIKAQTADHEQTSPNPGIVCTRGASVSRVNRVDLAGGLLRMLFFEVAGIPWNNSVEVDLSASPARFSSVWAGGIASLRSGGYQYGGQVGLNPPSTGKDVFTIWAKKGSGDPGSTCTASVWIWGV